MIEEKKHEINKILDENEIVLEPKVGMMFNSEEEVRAYYMQYAKQASFGVSKRTSKLGHDGNLKYFTISCVNQDPVVAPIFVESLTSPSIVETLVSSLSKCSFFAFGPAHAVSPFGLSSWSGVHNAFATILIGAPRRKMAIDKQILKS
ncbi:hypothetical protein CFP56_032068 [Quercus suber]|uniref:Uncharacterized protein n=1 Tax=Quercus suber TaxID=58331 RepID=A0AAW0JKH8_QUESU